MRRLEEHLATFVGPESDALVFTAPRGGPLARSLFSRRAWEPAAARAGLSGVTFHGLRHSFVAIFTLTRYGGLFEDGSGAAVDRLDALLGGGPGSSKTGRGVES
jgi:integrase